MLKKSTIPVAQYLRMSTEHQQYSTVNQSVAILQYAQDHNMEIVRTYADHGKSGLSLATRHGLQQLLKDAVGADVDFRAVLVYDVSRFGRFQNPDQAASYEYALNTADIPIHYCAEPFTNDGSLASAILKTLKRGMAGEYSRELSTKVWAGHRRLAEMGFRVGGYAGYGLRRQLTDADRNPKQMLRLGDRKSIQSDRVVLIPGPANEIKVVHRIYAMFIEKRLTEREIAAALNRKKVPWIGGRPWNRMCVRHILTNPKYVGASVYNRKSFKLHKEVVQNPRSEWIWCDGAFKPIVSEKRFEQARLVSSERAYAQSDEDLLDGLRALIKRKGRPTERLIDATQGIPGARSYIRRFGSLPAAYALVGWKPDVQQQLIDRNTAIRAVRSSVIQQLLETLRYVDGTRTLYRRTSVFTTNSDIALSLTVVRCREDKGGRNYWHVYCPKDVPAHALIVGRLAPTNDRILDYLVFPRGLLKDERITLGRLNVAAFDNRFESLDFLAKLLRRSHAEESPTESEVFRTIGKRTSIGLRLATLRSAMACLFADEDFRNLLIAEGFAQVPDVLRRQTSAEPEHLVLVISEQYVGKLLESRKIERFIHQRYQVLFGQLQRHSL